MNFQYLKQSCNRHSGSSIDVIMTVNLQNKILHLLKILLVISTLTSITITSIEDPISKVGDG